MSCRCCGSDFNQNTTAVSSNGSSNTVDNCFWPEFANLPRNTSSGCGCDRDSESVSYNESSSNGSFNNFNSVGCGCRRCR